MRRTGAILACAVILACAGVSAPIRVVASSVEKATMLREHALLPQAKTELIEVIFSAGTDSAKARAYYELGSIAFAERNITAALDTWKQLVDKYPTSPEAILVKGRIKELAEIAGEVTRTSADNVVAQSYLRHADFWSRGKEEVFQIDSSWIPNAEAAVKWYDKVIAEYPRSRASRLAYEGKLRALLGWKEPGQYGEAYGVKADANAYLPRLVSCFAAFESEHPDASSLQAFRYQIAQAYWAHRDWAKTREWLGEIIQKAGDQDTFYRDLAQRRLQKVEH
jgi:tetratricopeptide (TPR) repeat protein